MFPFTVYFIQFIETCQCASCFLYFCDIIPKIGRTSEFLDAVGDWVDNSALPAYFSIPRGVIFDKQQPLLWEAIYETVKRLRFIERFSAQLPEEVAGIICGGSMSYGRFYNIRGGKDPSDIDMFVIVDNEFFHSEDAQRELMHP